MPEENAANEAAEAVEAVEAAVEGSSEPSSFLSPEYLEIAQNWILANGVNWVIAIVIFLVGKWIAGFIRNRVKNALNKREVDPALVSFGSSILYYLLLIVVILAALNKVGFENTSLVAILGAAGLAVGLALQGSLANFAAGVLIIMFRPFRIGDVINAGGELGSVLEIGILVTTMKSPDNKKIIVPNGQIMSGSITNITAFDTRRVDMTVGVSYSDDLDKVKGIIEEVLGNDARVLKDPEPVVAVSELADSSVNFVVRPWVNKADYWGLFFDFQKTIKQRLDSEGVSIPFPQQDVYMHQVSD